MPTGLHAVFLLIFAAVGPVFAAPRKASHALERPDAAIHDIDVREPSDVHVPEPGELQLLPPVDATIEDGASSAVGANVVRPITATERESEVVSPWNLKSAFQEHEAGNMLRIFDGDVARAKTWLLDARGFDLTDDKAQALLARPTKWDVEEARLVRGALDETDWNPEKAAALLGVLPRTLKNKASLHGIRLPTHEKTLTEQIELALQAAEGNESAAARMLGVGRVFLWKNVPLKPKERFAVAKWAETEKALLQDAAADLEKAKAEQIALALRRSGGNKAEAARLLGIHHREVHQSLPPKTGPEIEVAPWEVTEATLVRRAMNFAPGAEAAALEITPYRFRRLAVGYGLAKRADAPKRAPKARKYATSTYRRALGEQIALAVEKAQGDRVAAAAILGIPDGTVYNNELPAREPVAGITPWAATEKDLLARALDAANGNQELAARAVGLHRETFRSLIARHGLLSRVSREKTALSLPAGIEPHESVLKSEVARAVELAGGRREEARRALGMNRGDFYRVAPAGADLRVDLWKITEAALAKSAFDEGKRRPRQVARILEYPLDRVQDLLERHGLLRPAKRR